MVLARHMDRYVTIKLETRMSMDKIVIKDLLLRGIIGLNPEERIKTRCSDQFSALY